VKFHGFIGSVAKAKSPACFEVLFGKLLVFYRERNDFSSSIDSLQINYLRRELALLSTSFSILLVISSLAS
jgi:hypothetical protein